MFASLWTCNGVSAFNMKKGVSDVSNSVYDLHMTMFFICICIGVIVYGFMFYAMIKHRKSKGAKASNFHENAFIEIVWTTIPFLILIAISIPATHTLIKIYNQDDSEIDIKITAYQWKWQYEYLGEGVSFFSNLQTPKEEIVGIRKKNPNYLLEVDNPLIIPVDKKVRFLVTSSDVIHSWFMPDFAIKRDAIPGFINEIWTKVKYIGTYRGQCAELCGKDHAYMPIVVEAKSQQEFDSWIKNKKIEAKKERELASKKWSKQELMTRGEATYKKICAACHQPNGKGSPPVFPALDGAAIVKDKDKIAHHIDIVTHGIKGTAMQAFIHQLSLVDIAAVITYERNAWGNKTGDVIYPQDINNYIKTGKYQPQNK
jgi:cytochrome c oxidase subunit 2